MAKHFNPNQKGMPSQRQLRVAELIRRALAQVFAVGKINDPDLENFIINISEVRITPDLHHSTILVTPLGLGEGKKLENALNRNASYIRGQISPQLKQMKYIPDLKFKYDSRYDEADTVSAYLKSE